MHLPIPILGKKGKPDFLLALLLRQEKATAVIIQQQKEKSTIVGKHEEFFQTNLEDASEEEWLKILDQTISKAEETLPPNLETHKTIFGVPASWVEEKHIKKDYLLKLKKTSEELSLTPIGFLEIPEAIAHLLMEEEGAPVSAILAEIGREYLSVSLVRGGRVIDTKFGKLQETAVKDVDRILRSFANVEVFPSRIIIFNGGYDEKLVQTFIAHQWSKSLPFLHVPQISILPEGFDAKAIVFGAATQMGFDISGALSLSQTDIKTFRAQSDSTKDADVETVTEEKAAKHTPTPIPQELKKPAVESASVQASQFGFVKNKDIELPDKNETEGKEKVLPKKSIEEEEVSEKTTEDISSHQTHAFTINSPYKENANVQLPPKEETFDMHTTPRDTTDETGASFFSRLPKIPQSLLGLLHVPRVPQNRFFLVLIPVVLLLLFGLLAAYIFLLHANVTVVVSPKGVDQNADVVFSTENDSDFDSNTIHAKTTSISLSGNTSTQATGKKETGTKAKGTVTLFNSSDNKKQIQQGTVITSTNSLDFTLDKDVTIASATGDIFSGIKSGTSEVGVTAKQIGSEYNLPSNIKFSVGGNSSLAAKNEQAFSGGSKKNITVVAQADIDKLTSALPKSLIAKARDTLSEKITADETLLTVIPDFKPSKKDFSDNVAEEAKTVSLKSSVTFAAISYDNNDLLEFTKAFIKDKFDPNLTVADKDIQNTIKNVDQKDSSSVKASLSMKASLLPKIDTVSLSETLAGASFAKTRETLMRYPQVEDVQITLFPPLPLLPEILPRQKGNITIEITTNE